MKESELIYRVLIKYCGLPQNVVIFLNSAVLMVVDLPSSGLIVKFDVHTHLHINAIFKDLPLSNEVFITGREIVQLPYDTLRLMFVC